jgi:hypothetical protein
MTAIVTNTIQNTKKRIIDIAQSIINSQNNNEKSLEFTDLYVTERVEQGLPIFEWDGTKGRISDYRINTRAGEWQLKIVAKHTEPSKGILVAVPTGRRTATIYKRAKVRELTEMGLHPTLALLYISRSRNIRYNLETDVVLWVSKNYLMPQVDFDVIVEAQIPKAAAKDLGYNTDSITQSRFTFCMDIVRNLRKEDRITQFAVKNHKLSKEQIQQIKEATYPSLMAENNGIEHYLNDEDVLIAIDLIAAYQQ